MPPRAPSRNSHGARRPLARLLGAALALAVMVAAGSIAKGGATAPATVWLCQPGAANDPCALSLDATVVSASGARSVQRAAASATTAFDCFYVYPTVSTEASANADLEIQPAEQDAAFAQAARFSQVCRVWSPVYRQQTLAALFSASPSAARAELDIAYASLLSAWQDYLAHDNHGRPIVFIGHSQGAAMLIRLLQSQIDPSSALRARLVSAIILGGNVTVPDGRDVGATFQHIPACTSAAATGCVIAYSSFPSQPPSDSLFGIPGQGVSIQSNQTASAGLEVLCVNPATLRSGSAPLDAYYPNTSQTRGSLQIATPWVAYPGLYDGACRHAGNATWLSVTPAGAHGDPRPLVLTESDGPEWGYHIDDVNLALGNLVEDVASEEAAYTRAHR